MRAIVLKALTIAAAAVIGTAAQAQDTTWYTSNPTAANFQISNASQLRGLATLVNGGNRNPVNFSGKTITLTGNIALGGGWIPIGTGGSFNGVFDGNGKTVSGLYINQPSSSQYMGLFGLTQNAKIIGLTLVADSIIGTGSAAGILIGRAEGSITIEDCSTSGYVSGSNVGGLIGYTIGQSASSTVVIKNCHTSGYFVGGRSGGLVGDVNNGGSSITITGSSAAGIVTGTSDVGGLIGFYSGNVNISESYSTCNVNGVGYVGGLVGFARSSNITNSFATGNVTGTGATGGLIGWSDSINISKCYSTGNVSGAGLGVGGLVGFSSGCIITGSFATGNITGTATGITTGTGIGGLIGHFSNVGGSNISKCYSTGNVSGNGYVGGFAGIAHGPVSNCYSTGKVSGGSNAGGFAGGGTATITNSYSTGRVSDGSVMHGFKSYDSTASNVRCFWDVETSNYPQTIKDTAAYAAGKTTAAMKQKATYTNWDFETVWIISEGNDYPRLRDVGGQHGVFSLVYRADANGSILGSVSQTVLRDSSGETVVAVPAAGYSFAMWSDGLKTASRTDADVTSDIDVTAIFAPEGARVLLYVAGDGGAIIGSAMQVVAPGESGTSVKAAPNTGYVFVSWDDGSKDTVRTDANITSDAVYTAAFAKIHSLSYAAGANGTILGLREQSVIAGSSGTMVMAVANAGYRFESWSDGVTAAERTDVNVSEDISVTAVFGEWKYILSYSANAEYGRILISGGSVQEFTERVDPGANGPQVMAVGNAGYTFHHWSDGVTTALRQDVDVQKDISVTAYFADAAGNVSVASHDRVIPQVKPNEEATVIAPVTVLSGEFTAGPNPVAKQSGSVNFYRQGKRVANCELRIYDATGNVISKVKISDKALNSQARRQVGSWDLKDAKGRPVSEGTYLVKGVVKTLDGKGEKVSVILGVR